MTGQPGNQRIADASRPPGESVQPAIESAIEKLAARQAAEMRTVGAELHGRLAVEADSSPTLPPQPRSTAPPLPPVAPPRGNADFQAAAEQPRAGLRRASAIVAAMLVLLLLAGIAGAVYLLVSNRHEQRGVLVAEPPALTATAAPATETSVLAAPAAAPATAAPANTVPATNAATLAPTPVAAATSVPTPVAAAAAAVPTSAAATATLAPTVVGVSASATVRSSATPSAAQFSPGDVARHAAAAEGALQRGQFEAVLDFGNGARATATVAFDYGDVTHPQRLHIKTVYTSPTGSQTSERIIVGDRAWDRQPDGHWVATTEQEGVWGRVQAFLPHADRAQAPDLWNDASGVNLHWTDADLDITVLLEPSSGIPRELRQVNHATGATLVVTYRGWNTPVDITPPTGT